MKKKFLVVLTALLALALPVSAGAVSDEAWVKTPAGTACSTSTLPKCSFVLMATFPNSPTWSFTFENKTVFNTQSPAICGNWYDGPGFHQTCNGTHGNDNFNTQWNAPSNLIGASYKAWARQPCVGGSGYHLSGTKSVGWSMPPWSPWVNYWAGFFLGSGCQTAAVPLGAMVDIPSEVIASSVSSK